jgi:hypothetical protein
MIDTVLDNNSSSSSLPNDEKFSSCIEQENSSLSTFSMMESIQNLFQRILKPSSSSSTPSTPKLSHQDQLNFRIRPFPMSSYNNEDIDPNPSNQRFYHVFKHGELEMLIEEASKTIVGLKIVKSYYDHGNWCAIVQKNLDISSL